MRQARLQSDASQAAGTGISVMLPDGAPYSFKSVNVISRRRDTPGSFSEQ